MLTTVLPKSILTCCGCNVFAQACTQNRTAWTTGILHGEKCVKTLCGWLLCYSIQFVM